MDYDIIQTHGHYDVYIDGNLYCSTDTHAEAMEEINQRIL